MQQAVPNVKILAVGKVKKSWIQDGIQVYLGRSPEIQIVEIKDSNPESEATKMLSLLSSSDRFIALSEEGKIMASTAFAQHLTNYSSNQLVFVMGGADGLSNTLKSRAELVLSLSPMTFPHELARLLLVEQLYRAKTILQGGRYHK